MFSLILFLILVGGILIIFKVIDNGNHYKIAVNTENLILGHSHTMSAFNDSIIEKTLNLSDNGENYFYTFVKLKKILKSNKSIKNVFISFTNNQINSSYDSATIWSNKYINYRYPKYAANFSKDEFYVLLKNNPIAVLKAQQSAIKNNLHLVFDDEKKIVKGAYWGGFNYLERNKTDSLIKTLGKNKPLKEFEYGVVTLKYLDEIITLCNESKTNIYLVRSPLHEKCKGLNNEYFLKKILKERYPDVAFLDFKNFL